MLGTGGKVLNRSTLTVLLPDCEKSAVKYSLEKPILLSFVDYFRNVLTKVVVLFVTTSSCNRLIYSFTCILIQLRLRLGPDF